MSERLEVFCQKSRKEWDSITASSVADHEPIGSTSRLVGCRGLSIIHASSPPAFQREGNCRVENPFPQVCEVVETRLSAERQFTFRIVFSVLSGTYVRQIRAIKENTSLEALLRILSTREQRRFSIRIPIGLEPF
ncbi:hypothetical protein K443DRAFT_672960 [Laccaria amethystina LaAM-08-1]|jgi:hypothetical protein|uniref:Uncharacterized protein n=1 Tax=Laccaria amethystina LaAM-08-1 TaxID=1095629 RepID=A0A0C9YCL4_9AGAR|nr:hypothetical protein K443DRAFT_672960 [Laccaria amethystina LaAM-08-1]